MICDNLRIMTCIFRLLLIPLRSPFALGNPRIETVKESWESWESWES